MEVVKSCFVLIVSFGLPVYFVIRLRFLGLVLGTLVMWLIGVGMSLGNMADPEYDSFAPGLWLFTGWIFSFIYCSFMLFVTTVRLSVSEDVVSKTNSICCEQK